MAGVSSYVKNVAKSFGYAIGDTFNDLNPVVTTLVKETKTVTSDLYQSIKSVSFQKDSIDERSFKGQARDIVSATWNNFKDDIKSGNWYNKERSEAASMEMAKAFGMDFDFDFDDNWDFDDDSDSDSAQLAMDSDNTKEIVGAVDAVGAGIANTVATATVESAGYIVASNNKASKALYSLNERGFANVTKGIISLNNTFSSFAQIMEPLQAHMQNSAVFYTKTTETLNSMNQSIQQLVKNTTPAPLSGSSKSYSSKRNKFTDIFSSDTGLSIEAYKDMIKENFSEYKDLTDMAVNALKGLTGGGKNISVMQFATTFFTKAMIPKMFKESMKNFNEELKYFASGSITKLRNRQGGFVFELLKDFLLPQDTFRSQIDPSKYNKGAVSWDGVSRKALTEVIPDALMMIYEALTGDSKRYDYNKGKFVSVSSIKKDFDDTRKNYIKSAGGDFREDALKKAESIKDNKKKDKITKEIENYFYQAFMSNDGYNVNSKKFDKSKYGVSDEAVAILRQIIEEDRKTGKKRHQKFTYDNISQRELYGDYIRSQESSGDIALLHTLNGSEAKRARLGGTSIDKWGNDNLFYLRGIYAYTGLLADNLKYIAGRAENIDYSGMRKRMNKKGGYSGEVYEAEGKSKGEKTKEEASRTTANESASADTFENEDDKRNKEREEKIKEAKGQAKTTIGKVKDWFKKVFGSKGEKGVIQEWYEKPFNSVALMLDKIGSGLDKLLWGDEENPEKGLFGYLFEKGKKFFDDLKEKLKIKEKWDELKENVKNSNVGQQFRNTMNKVKSSFGRTGRQILYGSDPVNNGRAAYGRKVTRTGIVAVSEGELIIPSELNPYYHGVTNKSKQIANETKAINNFYGAYAPGGEIPYEGKIRVREDKKKRGKYFQQYTNGQWDVIDQKKGRALYAKQQGKGLVGNIYKGLGKAKDTGIEFLTNLFGGDDKKSVEKEKKIIGTVIDESSKNLGNIGAGALLGAGASILTGVVVGPLAGAAIGGAVGLIANSTEIQKMLFGEDLIDKDGKVSGRKKGLLPKEIGDFITKSFPSMGKGAAIGGAVGMFMGSPILGAILGTTVGYVSSSKNAQEWLFGELDENGERKDNGAISKDLQDLVKKKAPNMAAGALAGLALGPFGIVGNLVVGAGLGFVTSSEKFHDWMFNEKDGLAILFKKKIFDNLDSIFRNFGHALSGWARNLIIGTGEKINKFFSNKKELFESGYGSIIGAAVSMGSKVGSGVKGATKFVGNRLAEINERRISKNLNKGYNVSAAVEEYDPISGTWKKNKRTLNAAERTALRSSGMGRAGSYQSYIDKYMAEITDINQLTDFRNALSDAKSSDKAIRNSAFEKLEKLGIRDAKHMKKSDINSALKNISTEAKDKRFGKEAQKELKEDNFKVDLLNITRNIAINLRKILERDPKSEEPVEGEELSKYESSLKGLKDGEKYKASVKSIFTGRRSVALDSETGPGSVKTHWTDEGPIRIKINSQGEEIPDISDANTNETMDKLDERRKGFASLAAIPSAFGAISGLFGKLHDKLFGEKDGEKKGIFGKLIESITGEDGLLGSILHFFTGNKVAGGIKSFISKFSFKSILATAIGIGLLATGLNGKFDKLFSKLGVSGDGNKGTAKDSEGNIRNIKIDENGNPVMDESGNYIDANTGESFNTKIGSTEITSSYATQKFSTKLKNNITKGFLGVSKGSVLDLALNPMKKKAGIKGNITAATVGNVLSKTGNKLTAVGSSTTKTITKLKDGIKHTVGKDGRDYYFNSVGKRVGKNAAVDSVEEILVNSKVSEGISKFGKALAKVPGFKKFASLITDKIVPKISEIAEAALKKSGKLLSKFGDILENLAWPLKIAAVAWDVSEGMQDARNTFQITTEPSTGQRLIAGAIRAIKNFIPFIGTLIPDRIFVDIFCEFLAPVLGIDVNKLKSDRAAAEEEAAEAGFDSVTDYLKTSKKEGGAGDFTLGEKIGNSIKTGWQNTKQGIAKFGSNVKNWSGKAGNAIKAGLEKTKNWASGAKSNIKNGFTTLSDNFPLIKERVMAGDPSGLWKLEFKDNPEDPVGGITKGIFNTIKLLSMPDAGLVWVGNKIKDAFSNIVSKAKNIVTVLNNERKYGEELFRTPESTLSDFFKIEDEDPENPIGGFTKAIRIINRLFGIPTAMVKVTGEKIKGFFSNMVSKVKNSISTMATNYIAIQEKIKAGNPSELWNLTFTEDPENPVGGFTEAIFNIQRVMSMPMAGISWVGHKIADIFRSTVAKVKNSISTMTTNSTAIQEKVKAGDPIGLWNLEFQEDPENPVGWVTESVFNVQRVMNMPMAGISWVGHKVGGFITDMINTSKSNHSKMETAIDIIKAFADEGDIGSIWKEDPGFEKGDPLKFVWSAGFNISKLFQSAVAIFNKIIGPVMDTVDKAKDLVTGFADSVGDFGEEVVDKAKWVGDKAKSGAKWAGDKAAEVGNWLYEGAQSLFGFGGGASGINQSHISQYDTRYKDMKLGSSTVGEKGCGPAVATMIANSYGRNLSMEDAIRKAQRYQDNGGTKSMYFADTLGSAGINTNYISGDNISKQVLSRIARGEQVILMGRNSKNVSKDKSPFGPNNHYVIASGIDKNGNIIIRDPESPHARAYNPSILNSASMGIGTTKSAGAFSNYDTDIARKTYGYFTSMGYSPLVASAIMGNLYGESGMNPASIQGGGEGPAAGIAQWENYNTKSGRWANLNEFASTMGYAWSDLDPQLQFIHKELQGLDPYFKGSGEAMSNLTKVGATPTTYAEWKNSTDLDMATRQFEAAFERAGKPHMEKRLEAAKQYYNLYSGSTYTGNYTAGEPGVAVDAYGNPSNGVVSSDSNSNGFTSILGAVSTAFSKIGDLFGFGSSGENTSGGLHDGGSYSRTGIYPSADLPTLSTNATKNFIDIAKSQVGVTEEYDNITEYGEFTGHNGQPWCASFVSWAMNKAYSGNPDKANKAMLGGPTGSSSELYNRFKNSNRFTVDKPMPGDIILYKNDNGDASRPAKHTGIVVDVNGNTVTTVEGNTSSDGSVEANGGIVWTKNRTIGSSALLGFGRPDWGANASASVAKPGSFSNARNTMVMSAAGSGLGKSMSSLMKAKFGSGRVQSNVKPNNAMRKSAGATGAGISRVADTTNMLTNLKNNISTSHKYGIPISSTSSGISTEVIEKLLAAITKILETISTNTSSVDKIYQVLSAYVQSGGSNAKALAAAKAAEKTSNNTEIDSTIVDLVGTLAQLAKG